MMINSKSIIGIVSVILISSCTAPETDSTNLIETEVLDTAEIALVDPLNKSDGFQLLASTCFSCHSPNPENENNIAPTMAELKTAYSNTYSSAETFTSAMQNFLAKPSAESAIMDQDVIKYGVMPQMSLQAEQSKAIALYLFENEMETVAWFANDFPKEQERIAANKENMSYVDRGFEYAMATKSVLGKNLKGKINSEGTLAAVSFCNLNAIHFTDSMSAVYNAEIKRVSDKSRNSNNQANANELEIIQGFKSQLENGEEIIPVTVEEQNHVFGYYPIVTNDMCLKCHGETGSMEAETYSKIALLYPQDKATGYATNQLRGIWVVKMTK
jgi:cytochrome c553